MTCWRCLSRFFFVFFSVLFVLFPHFLLHFGLLGGSAMADPGIGFWLMEGNSCCPSHNERRQRWEQLNRRDNHSLIQTVMQNLYSLHRQKSALSGCSRQNLPIANFNGLKGVEGGEHAPRKEPLVSQIRTWNQINLCASLSFANNFDCQWQQIVCPLSVITSCRQSRRNNWRLQLSYTRARRRPGNKAHLQNIKLSKCHFSEAANSHLRLRCLVKLRPCSPVDLNVKHISSPWQAVLIHLV